jgi:hypothetical protein
VRSYSDHVDGQAAPDEGATWLLDLVSAVDHLRRGIRPGFTVWDALEESLRWHTVAEGDESAEPEWGSPDPLRRTLTNFVESATGRLSCETQTAIRRWVVATADRYNAGHHWPHPAARRLFPPPAIDIVTVPDGDQETPTRFAPATGLTSPV